MIRSYDLDYVFHDDDPVERSSPYSTVSAPIYKGRENQSGTRDNNSAMVGSETWTYLAEYYTGFVTL